MKAGAPACQTRVKPERVGGEGNTAKRLWPFAGGRAKRYHRSTGSARN